MKIETTTKLSHPTLVLRGEFDTDSVDQFLTAVKSVQDGGGLRLMVSLRYVKYLNSTALGAIVRARSTMQDAGGDLIILQPSKLSREIITKMGLEGVLKIFEDEAAGAAHFAGVTVADPQPTSANPEAPTSTTVMFSFDDARAELIPGKTHHGVGTLDTVNATHLTFRWNPESHGTDAAACAAMFTPGSSMTNKLQIKLIRKGFFQGESEVESLSTNADGDAVVTAKWTRLTDADRADLTRHLEDLSFLKQKADESAAS